MFTAGGNPHRRAAFYSSMDPGKRGARRCLEMQPRRTGITPNVVHITLRVATHVHGAHIPHDRDVTSTPSEQHAQVRFTTGARRVHVTSTPQDSAGENASPWVVLSSCL